MDYTYEGLVDIHITYSQVNGNRHETLRLYHERSPWRRIPNHLIFANVDRGLRDTDSFVIFNTCMGYPRNKQIPETKEIAFNGFGAASFISIWVVAASIGVCYTAVGSILFKKWMQPFHVLNQCLNAEDYLKISLFLSLFIIYRFI